MATEFEVDDVQSVSSVLQEVMDDVNEKFSAMDYTDFMASIMSKLRQLHNNYFRSESGPGGVSWPPLAPSTIARKGHDEMLIDTRRLVNSLTSGNSDTIAINENNELVYGTRTPYARFHMTGGPNLPRREHIGLGQAETDAIAELVGDETVRQLIEV